MKKRLLATLLTLCMVLTMLPTAAFAADGYVAQIGNTTYATLDEAVQAVSDGGTIELLGDATTEGLNLSKSVTIKAAENLEEKPTITFTQYGIALWGKALTFQNVNVIMNGIGSTPYTAEWRWMTICASKDASLTLDNVEMTMDATGTINSPHAIYFCSNNKLNIQNGSNLTIENYVNDALEWDDGDGGYNVNITDSTFISDYNRSGFTGTFYVTIENSNVEVINSRGNGSNGSHFVIENSTVNFSDNGSHGLSAGNLIIKDHSVVTADHNGLYGVYTSGEFLVDATSQLTVTHNSYKGDNAGLKITSGVTNGKIEAGAEVTITDNYCSGLSNNGKVVFEEGAKLTITGNYNDKGTNSYGGGVYNSGGSADLTLPSDAVIYNNHADTAGDDIYNTGTISFGPVGSDWSLDGMILTGYDEETDASTIESDGTCTDKIDGWYDDSTNDRWSAHSAPAHAELVAPPVRYSASGPLALKAAHGLEPIQPGGETADWDIPKSKTATNLDANYESQITLSLPAAEKTLTNDSTEVGSDDIYYLLDKGSTVEDYMGYVADDYNFDFVNAVNKLTMKVGSVEYNAVSIGDNQYGFASKESGYDYTLTYVPGNKTSDEHFVWTTNVAVTKDAPVQLIYSVKLMNPKTTPGTYGTYDEDGSEGKDGLYTNNKAILYPVDSDGNHGLPEAFPKPTVSYTVDAPINSLTISKTVNGTTDPNVLDDEFTFTVQLPEDEGPYSYRYTAGNDSGETGPIRYNGTLTLQSGETVVIDGIPVGSPYTVSEAANRDFQTTVTKTDAANVDVLYSANAVSATGTIGAGGASAVHFVNTYSSGGSSGGGSTSTPGDNDGPGLNKQDHIAYVSGYPDGTVQPNGYITREEVATMFFRLLTDASRANYITNYNPFPDVARERWSFYSITTMNNADIMTGRTNGMFDPGANITRAEFAVVAAQFSKAQYTGPDKFSDISDHWARDYINRAAAEGWIAGYPDGTFGPERYITRAEVMALVNEVLDRAPDADYMLEDMIRWPDNPELTWYYEDVQEATNSHSYVWRNANHTVEEWKKWIPMRTYDQMVRDAFNGVGIDR